MAADRRHDVDFQALWSVNVEPLVRAVQVLRNGRRLRRFIYVSTISALDQSTRPSRVLDQNSKPAPRTDYGRSKLLAERVLLDSGIPVIVLRLPFLYGPHHSPNSFLAWYLQLARGNIMNCVDYGARLSLLYTGDFGRIAAAIVMGFASQLDDASSFLVSDGQVYSVNHLIDVICRLCATSRPPCLPAVASKIINSVLAGTRWKYWRHAAFDPNFFVVQLIGLPKDSSKL